MAGSEKVQGTRPVGHIVDPLPSGVAPDGRAHFGRWVTVEPLDARRHCAQLWDSFKNDDPEGNIWTYMGYGPFSDFSAFQEWLQNQESSRDPWFHALVPRHSGQAAGMAALMRIEPGHGVIEIGHIWMGPCLQKTREATEAIYLMMRHAFDELGYRRLEWKCDALNASSRVSAERFGFTFEGVFRQHLVVKGRNRDTAWYAIIDRDWPEIRKRCQHWLSDENFDSAGRQKRSLKAPE